MLERKRFGTSEKVIAETEASFESKDESLYKKGIDKLEKLWNECLHLKETMLINEVEFLEKNVFFLVRPGTYWVKMNRHTTFVG